jgi:hypothetical protein
VITQWTLAASRGAGIRVWSPDDNDTNRRIGRGSISHDLQMHLSQKDLHFVFLASGAEV